MAWYLLKHKNHSAFHTAGSVEPGNPLCFYPMCIDSGIVMLPRVFKTLFM